MRARMVAFIRSPRFYILGRTRKYLTRGILRSRRILRVVLPTVDSPRTKITVMTRRRKSKSSRHSTEAFDKIHIAFIFLESKGMNRNGKQETGLSTCGVGDSSVGSVSGGFGEFFGCVCPSTLCSNRLVLCFDRLPPAEIF